METYILKFSACLFVFWLVYVLFLERQNMHRFKRFYLLGALALALVIPTLTIIEYIEPVVTTFETASVYFPNELDLNDAPIEAPFFNLETILWLIYGLGVLLFSSRFVINLTKMQRRISKNENISKRSFVYVLLEANLIPHSFFRYIFFNKVRYESHHIPKEVMLHEETHAKQLHSLDVIILELLQIAFWFHPLVYILKHHVKLNHEFLADQAVLQQGSDAKTYQTILLQFSSNTQDYQLSSAINYSSIKKRFTVMKTQTSKTRIWLSTLLLLPIIAILFYNFAERVEVEKKATTIIKLEKNDVESYLQKYNTYELLRTAEPHYIYKSKEEQKELDDLFSDLGGLYFRMSKENKAKVKRPISAIKPYVQITLKGKTYFKKYSELAAEELATLPPPPPAPSTNQNNNYNFQEKPIMIILVNRKGQLLVDDELGSMESIEKQLKTLTKSFDKSRAVYLKYDETEDSYKVIKEVKSLIKKYDFKMIQADASQIAPPPPPAKQQKSKGGPNLGDTESIYNPSFLEFIIEMENEGASFYLNDKKISTAKAKSIAANNKGKSIDILTQLDDNGKYDVKLSNRQNNVSPDKEVGEDKETQEKPTTKEVAEYNAWAKKTNTAIEKADANPKENTYPIVKYKDVEKHKRIYNSMTTEQNKNAEPFPNFPPPPPPATENAKFGPIEINGATYYYTHQNGKTTYYDRYGKMVDINKIPPPPPIPNDATPEQKAKIQKATDAYMKANPDKVGTAKSTDGEIFEVIEIPEDLQGSVDINGETFYYTTSHGKTTYFNRYGKEVKMDNLPPVQSKNPSFLEYIEDMEKQGATFYLDNKKITAKEAKSIAINSKGKSTEMLSQLDESGKYVVKLSSPKEKKAQESIFPMVNGKTIKTGELTMTLGEIKNLQLTLLNNKIINFKLKIPGIKTELVKGNTITKTTLKNLLSAKTGDYITLFDIKDDKGSKFLPIAIEIIENP
ncbi:M56 family metallopeptidase [Winogradskyella ludwigii]|uniref:M56 family metallopeptidase n=1 Tax=Winogradskyella ludwigii TaxID=2686076 RepID=UPI0015C9E143|nr:M56 family metallopeptidase [Winogradskyella ludwigii]